MHVVAVAARGREHGRGGRGVTPGAGECLLSRCERELDRQAGAAALGGGQQITCRNGGGCGTVSLFAGEHRAARLPSTQARPDQTQAFDEREHQPDAPSTTLQLLPPKPNELLSTRLTRAFRGSIR